MSNFFYTDYRENPSYGETTFIAGTNAKEVKLKEYRYTGKERDDATGLYYYGARYYACWVGRWMSCDPLFKENPAVYEKEKPKDEEEKKKQEEEFKQKLYGEGLNLYSYVKDNPIKFIDPNGNEIIIEKRLHWFYYNLSKRGYRVTVKNQTLSDRAIDAIKDITGIGLFEAVVDVNFSDIGKDSINSYLSSEFAAKATRTAISKFIIGKLISVALNEGWYRISKKMDPLARAEVEQIVLENLIMHIYKKIYGGEPVEISSDKTIYTLDKKDDLGDIERRIEAISNLIYYYKYGFIKDDPKSQFKALDSLPEKEKKEIIKTASKCYYGN